MDCSHPANRVPICWPYLVLMPNGIAKIYGVTIKHPCECLDCGTEVDIDYFLKQAGQALARIFLR